MWLLYDSKGKVLVVGDGIPNSKLYENSGRIIIDDKEVLKGDIIHNLLIVDREVAPLNLKTYGSVGKYSINVDTKEIIEKKDFVPVEPKIPSCFKCFI